MIVKSIQKTYSCDKSTRPSMRAHTNRLTQTDRHTHTTTDTGWKNLCHECDRMVRTDDMTFANGGECGVVG